MANPITQLKTLADSNWTKIGYDETIDDNGFTLWSDSDIEFAETGTPGATESVPIATGVVITFNAPKYFWVKGSAGNNVYIAPFDF